VLFAHVSINNFTVFAIGNVVLLMGICDEPLSVVTEFMEGGSLFVYLRAHDTIAKEQTLKILTGIARGMLHLHLENIIHRDLATRNVLLTISLEPKISDFGMSRVNLNEDANKTDTNVGPLKWMAPECIKHSRYSLASDVWAYGVTIVEILSHDIPYPDTPGLQVATMVAREELRPTAPEGTSAPISYLIEHCCQYEPTVRPTFQWICDYLQDTPNLM